MPKTYHVPVPPASPSRPQSPAVASRPGALARSHPSVRVIAASWRSLTGGKPVKDPARRTLIACSGGADSAALCIALASAAGRSAPATLVIAHIVHDLRPRAQSLADRDSARDLALALGIPFVEAEVHVHAHVRARPDQNAESCARRLRYRALATLARGHDCPFVAAAHHADDQLETLLMRLIRGSGPRGLRGVHPSRALTPSTRLIRPMLALTHAHAVQVCRDAHWPWREDATNADRSRLRNALRHGVLPALENITPHASIRAARAARHLTQLHDLLAASCQALWGAGKSGQTAPGTSSRTWPRAVLRSEPEIVLGELLRHAHRVLLRRGLDDLSERTIAQAVKAIRSPSGERKQLNLAGLRLQISSDSVRVAREAGTPVTPDLPGTSRGANHCRV